MVKRTFYVALGVPRGADPDAVHPAYRRVVARYREDLDRAAAAVPEPEKLTEELTRFSVMRSYSERRHAGLFDEPEPLVPERGESDVDRFFGGIVPEVTSRRQRARPTGKKDLFVELRLMAQEARRGGLFPVHIPVLRTCPSCGGDDEEHQRACRTCKGSGRVIEDRMVDVAAPPGVQHGEAARIPMEDVGLDETDLIVKVVVSRVRTD